MGKDLKGKELGEGLSQRKDGYYTARISDGFGNRKQKYFKKLKDAKAWLVDAKFQVEHGTINVSGDISVDNWYKYWITEIKSPNVRPNTIRNYDDRFKINISPMIGRMSIKDVRPIHCQNVLNKMAKDGYGNACIDHTRVTMFGFFQYAVDNDMIIKNPVTRSVKCTSGKPPKKVRALTLEEQEKFIAVARGTSMFNAYAFILQTGLRTGELVGLRWQDVDLEQRVIHVRQTMEYRYQVGEWRTGDPKTKHGFRDIPLTQEAVDILLEQRRKRSRLRVIPIEFADIVFLCRKGTPTRNSTYDSKLFILCDKAGIRRFSMHVLRHTFATRCIEAGMKPKTLQKILGHANITVTMNTYVHVTEDEKAKELSRVENYLKSKIS